MSRSLYTPVYNTYIGGEDDESDDDEPYAAVDGRRDGGARLNIGQDDLKNVNRGSVGVHLAILAASNPGKEMFERDVPGVQGVGRRSRSTIMDTALTDRLNAKYRRVGINPRVFACIRIKQRKKIKFNFRNFANRLVATNQHREFVCDAAIIPSMYGDCLQFLLID